DYDLHINFPGGTPIDGPSAGVTMATAIYSAIKQIHVDHRIAMTGEVSIHGKIKPIGGVVAKIEAARQAGVKKVIIPKENWQSAFDNITDMTIIPVERITDVFEHVFTAEIKESTFPQKADILTATSAPL
ncbi:MAG: S16 family serine protease, partial [Bacilli bacterium]